VRARPAGREAGITAGVGWTGVVQPVLVVRTIKIVLAYDGTEFVGWQRQANGRSVQGMLEDALARIDGRPVPVAGAGRTDAGVHALGQVASFRLTSDIAEVVLRQALNALLPADIRVMNVEEAPAQFNARFAARSKTYRYRIVNAAVLSPFERRFAWHLPRALDLKAMRAAAAALKGRHDFAAFQAAGGLVSSSVRTLYESRWLEEAHGERGGGLTLAYQVSGDGFLRHMVRNIVGTLVEVGTGRRTSASIVDVLASRDRGVAGPTAPAHGLRLVQVDYEEMFATGEDDEDEMA
jgi:tRNA pseudouridine38-40 synthase